MWGSGSQTFMLVTPDPILITDDLISVDVSCKTFSQKVNLLFRLGAFSDLKRLKYSVFFVSPLTLLWYIVTSQIYLDP